MGFRAGFGKLLKLNTAGVAKLAYAADSKSEPLSFLSASKLFETPSIRRQKRTRRAQAICGNFEPFRSFLKETVPKTVPKEFLARIQGTKGGRAAENRLGQFSISREIRSISCRRCLSSHSRIGKDAIPPRPAWEIE